MTIPNTLHSCEYGWSIRLPTNWVRLSGSLDTPVLAMSQPVVFAISEEWEPSLAWMLRGYPVDDATAGAFLEATLNEGSAEKAAVVPLINSIFRLIGDLDEATVITLADGSRALETTESYYEGEVKRGYQLIVPLSVPSGQAPTFQRLCFYAPAMVFNQYLEEVRNAARSFRYERPYGYKRPE